MKKTESKKIIRASVAIFLIGIVALVIGVSLIKNNSKKSVISSAPAKKSQIAKAMPNNKKLSQSQLYPRESLACQTSISLVDLSSDYVISGMNCSPASNPSANAVLSCDGTIFSSVISQNCYSPLLNSISNSLLCSGALGQLSGSNMSLNYSCNLPNIANTNIYSCNGVITNYTSYAVNLPMSVSCSSSSLG